MDKQQIIDYIMHTPSNTNPAMLGQFLDEYSRESGENWSTLFEGEVTTEEDKYGMYSVILPNSSYINTNKIKVTFNNVEYECDKILFNEENYYGGFSEEGPVFSEYPFAIMSNSDGTVFYVESPGTYSIKIEAPQESEGSEDWSTAEVIFLNNSTAQDYYVEIASVTPTGLWLIQASVPFGSVLKTGDFIPGGKKVTIPLYKQTYVLESSNLSNVDADIMPIISGAITFKNDLFYITGNGTIELSGKEPEEEGAI